MSILSLFLLCPVLVFSGEVTLTSNIRFSYSVETDTEEVLLVYDVDHAFLDTCEWFGMGIQPESNPGTMSGADLWTVNLVRNTLSDQHLDEFDQNGRPKIDQSDDVTLSIETVSARTHITVRRLLDTKDQDDRKLVVGNRYYAMYACGEYRGPIVMEHTSKGMSLFTFSIDEDQEEDANDDDNDNDNDNEDVQQIAADQITYSTTTVLSSFLVLLLT